MLSTRAGRTATRLRGESPPARARDRSPPRVSARRLRFRHRGRRGISAGRRRSRAAYEQQEHTADEEDADSNPCGVEASQLLAVDVRETGPKHIGANRDENYRQQGIKRNGERSFDLRVSPAKNEKRQPRQQEKEPEYRRRELDHCFESTAGDCTDRD